MRIHVILKWHLLGYFCSENPRRKSSAVQLSRLYMSLYVNVIPPPLNFCLVETYQQYTREQLQCNEKCVLSMFFLCQYSLAFILIEQWTDFHFVHSCFPYTNLSVSFFSLHRKVNCSLRKNVLIFSCLFELNVAFSAYFAAFFESKGLEHHLGLELDFVAVETLTAKILVNIKILICTSQPLMIISIVHWANFQTTFLALAPAVTSVVANNFPTPASETMIWCPSSDLSVIFTFVTAVPEGKGGKSVNEIYGKTIACPMLAICF